MMNEKDWLERATKFDLGTCIFYNRPIQIEARDQIDGTRKWILKMNEWVLGKDGEFYYEHMPSSRTDFFIENTRFEFPNDAHSSWARNVNKAKPLHL